VSQSGTLQRRVESGHLDVAFVKQAVGDRHGRLVRRDRLVWAGVPGTQVKPDAPVPLVVYQAPSLTRSLAVQALDRAGLPYRVTCAARGVLGVVAAARAGLGLAVFARSLVPGELVELPAGGGLPNLGEINLVLLSRPGAVTEPAKALTSAILASGHPIAVSRPGGATA
jgi:DNA-binding transcriptional LysR family regulator